MPQSSLSSWLNKSTASQQSESVTISKSVEAHDDTAIESSMPLVGSQENAVTETKSAHINSQTRGKGLPANVELRACRKEDLPHLKRLTSLLLPIPYPEKFYSDIVNDALTNHLTLIAVWHDEPSAAGKEKGRLVGAVRCRLLSQAPTTASTHAETDERPMLYLSTLVMLSPYWRYAI